MARFAAGATCCYTEWFRIIDMGLEHGWTSMFECVEGIFPQAFGKRRVSVTLAGFALGLVLLIIGAEALVRGASRLAAAAGIPPLIVGLTVVAFGTSAPELAVGLKSTLAGQPDIAVGNVVGSNIYNVLLILGLAALVAPLTVSHQLVRLDVPLMIIASGLLWWMGADARIGRLEGALLFAGFVGYSAFLFVESRKQPPKPSAPAPRPVRPPAGRAARRLAVDLVLVAAGLGLLVAGADRLVHSAVAIARSLGLSELIIGLTIVAGGTSLPELAASVVAGLRGERDLAVGNVVGSNLFNILVVAGLTAAVSDQGLPVSAAALRVDIPVMIAVAVACLPVFFTGGRISRLEGGFFLLYCGAYTFYLIVAQSRPETVGPFNLAMTGFVMPITAATLIVSVVRAQAGRSRPPAGR
jgi:cation:H+ antiporter